jgi:hypothetical protein
MGDVTCEPVPTTEGNRRPAAGASSPEQDDEGYGRSAAGERGDRPACGRPQHGQSVHRAPTQIVLLGKQAPARAGRGETVHRAAGSSAWRQGALHKTDGARGPVRSRSIGYRACQRGSAGGCLALRRLLLCLPGPSTSTSTRARRHTACQACVHVLCRGIYA